MENSIEGRLRFNNYELITMSTYMYLHCPGTAPGLPSAARLLHHVTRNHRVLWIKAVRSSLYQWLQVWPSCERGRWSCGSLLGDC